MNRNVYGGLNSSHSCSGLLFFYCSMLLLLCGSELLLCWSLLIFCGLLFLCDGVLLLFCCSGLRKLGVTDICMDTHTHTQGRQRQKYRHRYRPKHTHTFSARSVLCGLCFHSDRISRAAVEATEGGVPGAGNTAAGTSSGTAGLALLVLVAVLAAVELVAAAVDNWF
jgi:hypothetical protein